MRASPVLTSGFLSPRESRARHKSLTRWEDDGGRVFDKPEVLSTGSPPGGALSRAQSTTA